MAKKKATEKDSAGPWDFVMFRHVVAGKQDDFERISDMIESPFDGGGSVYSSGMISAKNSGTTPADRWMVIAQFKNSNWIHAYSNVLSASECFDHLATGRRVEVFQASCDESNDLRLRYASEKKNVLDFQGNLYGQDYAGLSCPNRSLHSKIMKCMSVVEAKDLICNHFGIQIPGPVVRGNDCAFEVIGASGTKVRTGMRAYQVFHAYGLPADSGSESIKASMMMDKGLDNGDPKLVAKAIESGASLSQLPESSLSPLLSALFGCGRKKHWRECSQKLIDAGASMETSGMQNGPVIIECCDHLIHEQDSIEITRFLIDNGADVNAVAPNKATALGTAATQNRHELVELLMEKGANPDVKCRYGDGNIVDFIRQRMSDELQRAKGTPFIKTLELLTGQEVQRPKVKALSKSLQEENQRFVEVANAQAVLRFLPEKPKYKAITTSRLAGNELFLPTVGALHELGFRESGHYLLTATTRIFKSLYSHPESGFEVEVSCNEWSDGDQLRVEIGAFHPDETCTVVTNLPFDEIAGQSQIVHLHSFENASMKELVDRLKELVREKQIVSLDPATHLDRAKALNERLLDELRSNMNEVLMNGLRDSYGNLKRFEIAQHYYWPHDVEKYPDHSTALMTDDSLKELTEEVGYDDLFNRQMQLAAAAHLCLLRHFQFAGAPSNAGFLELGVRRGIELFQFVADSKNAAREHWGVVDWCYVMGMAMIRDDWDAVATVSELLLSGYANARKRTQGEPAVQLAQLQLVISDSFRKTRVRGVTTLTDKIRAGRNSQSKRLLETWQAIASKNQNGFEKAFRKSLNKSIDVTKKESLHSFAPSDCAAWLDSILAMLARKRGMKLPKLKEEKSVFLLLPETIE